MYTNSDGHAALQVARHVIGRCAKAGAPVSNLHLQKILYCSQRELLRRGARAFKEDFEAWQFGPVIPCVYHAYCGFGSLPITIVLDSDVPMEIKIVIDPIIDVNRRLLPWDLADDVQRQGGAWKTVYGDGNGRYRTIPKDLILELG